MVTTCPQIPREECSVFGSCSFSCIQQQSTWEISHICECPGGGLPSLPLSHHSLHPAPHPSPSIHTLNLSSTTATGGQVCREAAPDKIIPFSFSNAALKQDSDFCADSRPLPSVTSSDSRFGLPCSNGWLEGGWNDSQIYLPRGRGAGVHC